MSTITMKTIPKTKTVMMSISILRLARMKTPATKATMAMTTKKPTTTKPNKPYVAC